MRRVLALTKAIPKLKKAKAQATSVVSPDLELTVLEHQAHSGNPEDHEERGKRQCDEEDLAESARQGHSEVVHPAGVGEPRKCGEQHGADGHGEHPLGQLEETKGLVDDSRGGLADVARYDSAHEGVEVHNAQREHDRPQQTTYLPHRRVAKVKTQTEGIPASPHRRHLDHQLCHGPRDGPPRKYVEGAIAAGVGCEEDHRPDDNQVPHDGRERGQGEMVVGVQHSHEDAGDPQQNHRREHDPGETDGQIDGGWVPITGGGDADDLRGEHHAEGADGP